MPREVASASIDDARLATIELGVERDGPPPEVRTAAVQRSRRIPEPAAMGPPTDRRAEPVRYRGGRARLLNLGFP